MLYSSVAKIIGYADNTKICARAARISTTKGNSLEIYEKQKSPGEDSNLITKVLASGHKSFIEHAIFTIAFCNVSALVEQFIIEFRLLSLTIKSRRYVDFGEMGFYTPGFLQPQHLEKYTAHMNFLFGEYSYFIANGIPKEDARFVLPYSFYSNFYCTINARELAHIIKDMKYGRGKDFPELQNLASQLVRQLNDIMPSLAKELAEMPRDNCADTGDLVERIKKIKREKPAHSPNALVKLISSTPDIKQNILAGYLLGNNLPVDCLPDIINDAALTKELLNMAAHKHRARELEQINLSFLISGVSLAGITHIARHRIQSLIIPSLAHIRTERFLTPDTIAANQKLLERYLGAFSKTAEEKKDMLGLGYSEYQLAYYALSGNLLDIMTTMNGRELRLFISLRTCNRAQWEVRRIALDMLRQAYAVSQELFANFGPNCFMDGFCPEGQLTCGNINEVKACFSENPLNKRGKSDD